MSRWKWFVFLPVLAALCVFAPGLLGPKSTENGAEPTEAVFRREAGAAEIPSGLEVGGALALVLAIAVGGVWVIRRLQNGPLPTGEREIQLKETRRLSPKRSVHLLRAVDRLLLVSESEQGVHLIADLTPQGAEDAVSCPNPIAEDADDGAVPRDLVLPATPPARRKVKHGNFRELLNRLG